MRLAIVHRLDLKFIEVIDKRFEQALGIRVIRQLKRCVFPCSGTEPYRIHRPSPLIAFCAKLETGRRLRRAAARSIQQDRYCSAEHSNALTAILNYSGVDSR